MMQKKIFIIFLFSIFYANISAQKIPVDTAAFPFIRFDRNRLEIPEGSDSARINAFYAKLDTFYQTKKGNINILHIGASHVQGGFFSDKIRRNFDFLNNGQQSSRGLIFPFKVAKTNNPTNYIVKHSGTWTSEHNVKRTYELPLGVTGIAVATADDMASISVRLNPDENNKRWQFDTLVLIGQNIDKEMVTPLLQTGDSSFLEGVFNENLHTYTYVLPEKADTFRLVFRQNDKLSHKFVVGGFLPISTEPGIVYHDIGVNGAAVPSYLGCEDFEKELALVKPDLVIFGIGINDAVSDNFREEIFVNNYNKLIERIKNISPDCAFIFITNNDSYKNVRQAYTRKKRRRYRTVSVVNRNGETAATAFYEIARQNNGAVWNQFEIMGGLKSMQQWQNASLAAHDKIHFTKTGYELLGDLFFNAILQKKSVE